jgi:hypothetical protein
MSSRRYDVFELFIHPMGDTYKAQVMRSPGGTGETAFESPFASEEIEAFLVQLGFRRRTRGGTPLAAAQELGGRLFKAVFRDEILVAFRNSIASCSKRNRRLRLLLRLDSVPDLAVLPWEYLFDSVHGTFLGHTEDTTIVRCPFVGDAPRRLQIRPPLRVLVVTADPKDYPQLEIEREFAHLRDAFSSSPFLIDHSRMSGSTLESLRQRLKSESFHVLHFIGHGEFHEDTEQGFLVLEDQSQKAHLVDSHRLASVLHRPLSLVVLNACHGARVAALNPFGGVAYALLRSGIPAVAAMQSFVSDAAAVTFAREFYNDLAQNGSVDQAVAVARQSIFDRSDIEWGIPVLYLRSDDDRIFQAKKLKIPHEDTGKKMSALVSRSVPPSGLEEIKWSVSLRAAGLRGYMVTSRSPAGEVAEHMSSPLEIERLSAMFKTLAARTHEKQAGIHGQSELTESAERVGEVLCEALVPSALRREFDTTYKRARSGQVRLSFSLEIGWEARRMASLPWEFLHRESFLNLERTVYFFRSLHCGRSTGMISCESPLRILVVGPSCEDSGEKRWWTDRKWTKGQGIEIETLVDSNTKEALHHSLWRGGFDVLHLSGRAIVKEHSWKGVLLLESRGEGMQPVDAEYLAKHMSEECSKRLQLVSFEAINHIEGEINPLIDLAGTLVGRGAPCTLALHFPLSSRAASAFWSTVYRLLAKGEAVSRAVSDGRRAVHVECPHSKEWGSPTLFAALPEETLMIKNWQAG